MAKKLSDERIEQIHREYYEAKTKMRSTIHQVAVIYFSKTTFQNSLIEKPIGSIMNWANSDFESIEDRKPENMVSIPILKKVILEGLLKEMVAYHYITQEQVNEFLLSFQ